ncbi:MAG TPA: ASKHA domain-containing protein [Anaerolineae bacterium]|nr:ASKHA domain-containing protein [Anaerolineae bacterium]
MTNSSATFQIDLQPVGRRIEVTAEQTLLEAAQNSGLELVAVCGGNGSCATCRVRLVRGRLSAVTSIETDELETEELDAGYRLACQARPLSDVQIDIPAQSLTTPQRTQLEGLEIDIAVNPNVFPIDLNIKEPDQSDLRSDTTRLNAALLALGHAPVSIDLPVLVDISDRLRRQNWIARLAVRHHADRSEAVAILLPQTRLLGLAADIGTTKVAAYLIDLSNGQTLAQAGAMNPQIAYGEDVVSRIAYTNNHRDGRKVLQHKIVETLNQLTAELCAQAHSAREQIVDAVVVGNTAMHHLFAGLPVTQLGTAPYVPAISNAFEVPALDIGLDLAAGAKVYLPPNIAGFVGADHVSMVLAAGIDRSAQTTVGIDIGTNTEITLAHHGRLLSCSCASGPAFEGAHIHDGMRAAPGAIERVQIDGSVIRYHTIGNRPPVGVCGSGILDAIAQMKQANIIDRRGVLRKDHPLVHTGDGRNEMILVPAKATGHSQDILVTRHDITEIQLAKAAIRAGIDILLTQVNVSYQAIDTFIIAGAFGTYLDLNSAIVIGMFPKLPLPRFKQIGNAAGMGAKQMLVSRVQRHAAAELAQRVEYIELTTYPGFTDRFAAAMYL